MQCQEDFISLQYINIMKYEQLSVIQAEKQQGKVFSKSIFEIKNRTRSGKFLERPFDYQRV